ncbi:hypothetical protein MUG91_G6n297 [Manis pentadactyla]|nr:hypothetical protein MUG91_G6n297 [Manis pentadactyla]
MNARDSEVAAQRIRFPRKKWPRRELTWEHRGSGLRRGRAETERFMSEWTNGMAAPSCQRYGGRPSGGGPWNRGRGLGGAHINWRLAAGGAWGGWWPLGGRGTGREARAGGSERASRDAEDPIHSLGRPMGRRRQGPRPRDCHSSGCCTSFEVTGDPP